MILFSILCKDPTRLPGAMEREGERGPLSGVQIGIGFGKVKSKDLFVLIEVERSSYPKKKKHG